MNWRGKPLVSHQVIVQLIGSTTTKTGLTVCCELDANQYPKGIKVSDEEMQAINITRDEFHGEWNYTICPTNNLLEALIYPQALTGVVGIFERLLVAIGDPADHRRNMIENFADGIAHL